MKKCNKILLTIAIVVFICIYILTVFSNLMSLAVIIVLLPIIYFMRKWVIKNNKKYKLIEIIKQNFTAFLFIFAFAIRFIVLMILKIEPYSDYLNLLNTAWELSKGINIMPESQYFLMWGFQTGYVIYETIVLKIFHTEMILHILDCFYAASNCVMIYLIGKNILEADEKIPSFIYSIYLFGIAYVGILSNHHIYVFLTLIAIYLWIKKEDKNWIYSILVGLILAIANIMRPETILILVTILVFEIMKIKNKEDVINTIKKLLILFTTFIIIVQGSSFLIKTSGLNPSGLDNKNILWKFVCGADYETGGRYSKTGEEIMFDKEAEKDFIINSYSNLDINEWAIFLKKKIDNFWTQDSYSWFSENSEEKDYKIIGNIPSSVIINTVRILDGIGYLFVFFFAIISIINAKKENNEKSNINFFVILLLLHFAVYLVIEVQTRYAYLARIIIFILAMKGLKNFKKIKE